MGKAAKSVAYVSDKKVKSEIKKQQLQKVKKVGNAIKKVGKDKGKEDLQLKNDYEELRALLRLDANQGGSDNYHNNNNMDIGNESEQMQVDKQTLLQELRKKKKLSTKKRRYLQLLKSNPQRE